MGLMTILKTAKSAVKAAGRLSGVIGTHDTGIPIKGRKKRLVAAVGALLVAWGYLDPEVSAALQELVLALTE